MNIDEFFEELAKVDMEWVLQARWNDPNLKQLRAKKDSCFFCPITAVCYKITNNYHPIMNWESAAEDLNLSFTAARDIVMAADNLPQSTKLSIKGAKLMEIIQR